MPLTPAHSLNSRASARTNMFIAAMLHSANVSTPVRVRNMSAEGVLLETAAAPGEGAQVRLVRGSLQAKGVVKWRAGDRCGVRFTAKVDVAQWLKPTTNRQQQRVDGVVRSLKAGARPLPVGAWSGSRPRPVSSPTVEIGLDLRQVSDILEKLAENFAGDSEVLARYSDCIQAVDIAVQTLRTAAGILVGDADSTDELDVRLASLRTSCAQSLEQITDPTP